MNFPNITVKENFRTGSLTWTNIEWLRKLTKLPIICKGILSPIDAELAIKYGANGIIVRFIFCINSANWTYFWLLLLFSNHGGRQVDTAPPAIECLEDIVNVVDGRAEGKFDLMWD